MNKCKRCGKEIEDDESDNNEGYCDECSFDMEAEGDTDNMREDNGN